MVRRMVRTAGILILVGMVASTAAGQKSVDLRVNLATQPVYAPFGRMPMDYLNLPSLYATGNVRGGRAFMGNRNFLEDRYFNSSLSRFYRDSVNVGDVTRGMHYGPGQAMFSPGSLGASGSSVGQYTLRQPTPYGLSYNPTAALPSPYSSLFIVRTESLKPTQAQYPSPRAVRSWLQQVMDDSDKTSKTTRPLTPYVRTEGDEQVPIPRLDAYLEAARLSPLEATEPDTGALPSEGSDPQGPGEMLPSRGVRPLDFLRQRFGDAALLAEIPDEAPQAPLFDPVELEGLPDDSQMGAIEGQVTLPEMQTGIPLRSARFDEQYLELARLEMGIGAYRPAAEAYARVPDFNPMRRWEASTGEAYARLLVKDFYLAAYLLKYSVVTKPEELRKDFRLKEIVDRPEDWQATEQALAKALGESPNSTHLAFAMAYLKIFSGRAGEAESHLKVAGQSKEFAPAVKLLREKVIR